ncbi:MAG: carboxypeptidase regulatory-like domain-containing protein, partial [Planctomycetota bacterium]
MNAKIVVPVAIFIVAAALGLMVLVGNMSERDDATIDLGPAGVEGENLGGPPERQGQPDPVTPKEPTTTDKPSEAESIEEVVEETGEKGESRLAGTILDARDDSPVGGARFEVFLASGDEAVASALTNGGGRFEINGLDTGRVYRWVAGKEGYAEARGDRMAFSIEEEEGSGGPEPAEIELEPIRLGPGGILAGTVRIKGGAALVGAEVRIHPLARTPEGLSYPDVKRTFLAVSDGTGRFENRALPVGRFRVMGQADGYARKVVNGVEVTAGKRTRLDFELESEALLSGTVRDMAGIPVPGARINGTYLGKAGSFEIPTTLTGEDGRFTVHHVPPGRCNIKADAKGYGSHIRMSVPVPTAEADFTLGMTTGAIEGTVTGPAGPVDGFEVKYYEEKPGNYQLAAVAMMEAKTRSFEGAGGEYRIEGLPPA